MTAEIRKGQVGGRKECRRQCLIVLQYLSRFQKFTSRARPEIPIAAINLLLCNFQCIDGRKILYATGLIWTISALPPRKSIISLLPVRTILFSDCTAMEKIGSSTRVFWELRAQLLSSTERPTDAGLHSVPKLFRDIALSAHEHRGERCGGDLCGFGCR